MVPNNYKRWCTDPCEFELKHAKEKTEKHRVYWFQLHHKKTCAKPKLDFEFKEKYYTIACQKFKNLYRILKSHNLLNLTKCKLYTYNLILRRIQSLRQGLKSSPGHDLRRHLHWYQHEGHLLEDEADW